MNWLRFVFLSALAALLAIQLPAQGPLFGGLSGSSLPGQTTSTFGWRPFIGLTGNYYHNLTTTLNGVSTPDLYGFGILGGVSGSKSWGRTSLGLSYRGFGRFTYRNGGLTAAQNHSIAVGVTHRMTPRLSLFASQLGGRTDGGMGFGSLIGGVGGLAPIYGFSANPGFNTNPVDDTLGNPSNNNLVDDEVFDTPTYFSSTTGGLNYRLTERSSVSAGAAGVLMRRSEGQFGVQGYSLRGNYSYTLNSRSSLGFFYGFGSMNYHNAFGNMYNQSMAMSYQRLITPTVSLYVSGGAFYITSQFVGLVPLDPVLAEILGKPNGLEIQQTNRWSYSGALNLSKAFRNSSVGLFARRQFFPGNGLVLGAERTVGGLFYSHKTTDKLSLATGATYSHYRGVVQRDFAASNYGFSVISSYRLTDEFHLRVGFMVRVLERTNAKTLYQTSTNAGVFWSPGIYPLGF